MIRPSLIVFAWLGAMLPAGGLAVAAGPAALPHQNLVASPITQPVDHAFGGAIVLDVDATDTDRKIFTVHEQIPVQRAGRVTLLYPRWEAASHGPSLDVADLAGLELRADGQALGWRRDPIEPHAFHIEIPPGARMVEARFQIVAGGAQLSPDLVVIPWQRLILYPAGYYARNLVMDASVALPAGLQPLSALDATTAGNGRLRFTALTLESLLDSPVYAARHARRVALSPPAEGAVSLDLLADSASDLEIDPERVEHFRRLVGQARLVFGPAPYRRYAFLARLSPDGSAGGTEHRESSEIALPSDYFRDWAGQLNNRDIIAHEFVHAWNGLFRVPADLWTPTPNLPQGTSLLWAYEGQSEFWGRILAARAGLRSAQETLDKLALDAAEVANRPGREWRPLSDDVNYPGFMLRRSVPWRDWQRRKDYYLEGVMLWLDVDALIREHSGGRHGLDDFAHRFFAAASPSAPSRTYTFEDLCAALAAVAPYDWSAFLRGWIDGHREVDTSDGLRRQGWKLVYTDVPTETFRQNAQELGVTDLSYSIGLTIAADGRLRSVSWDGPAFRAGLAPSARIVEVAGKPFTAAALVEAVRNAAVVPVRLTAEQDGRQRPINLDYRGTLRYPRLERLAGQPDRLSALLAPR